MRELTVYPCAIQVSVHHSTGGSRVGVPPLSLQLQDCRQLLARGRREPWWLRTAQHSAGLRERGLLTQLCPWPREEHARFREGAGQRADVPGGLCRWEAGGGLWGGAPTSPWRPTRPFLPKGAVQGSR